VDSYADAEQTAEIINFNCLTFSLYCDRIITTFPVDDRTFRALLNEGILHEETDLEEASSWLGRQVNAKDVAKVHGSLHSWVESNPVAKKKTTKKTAKKTTKKTTKKVVKKIPTRSVKKKVVKQKATKKKTAKKKISKK